MKFGKELVSQMVPEWQDAYMDYNFLKSILKDALRCRQMNSWPSPRASMTTSQGPLKRRGSLYRAFSGLTSQYTWNSPGRSSEDEEVILVSSAQEEGSDHGRYQTMFLRLSDEGGEYDLLFFRRLDDEFNKVLCFYKKKVEEVVAEADELSKQMNALIALRIRVEKPVMEKPIQGTNTSIAAIDILPSSASVSVNNTRSGWTQMGVIQEVEMTSEKNNEPKDRDDGTAKAADSDHKANRRGANSSNFRSAPISIKEHVKVTVQPQSPVLAANGILMSSNGDMLFTKAELRKAEELLTGAFTEFYQKLQILKSYCFLNQLAFSKIMKKYDKITRHNASKSYLKMVDDSYLGSSDEVSRLMERVEAAFIKHFANGNRRKGMRTLRPTAKREKHRITFFLGCFTGCSLALIVSIIVAVHARNLLKSDGRQKYMETIFPLYSLFGFIILHMAMYAADIYFWRRYRINYSFVFGFKKGTELGYREVLLLSSGLSVLMLVGVLSNLDMDMDPRMESYKTLTELVPLGLFVVVTCITFCPFNIMYRSSRFFLIHCAFHCICAPFYKVTLPDFFLADQLTSQVQAFRNLEFYICYYGWGDFRTRSNKCDESKLYEAFYFVVAVIPYGMRFLQCLRRLYDEGDIMQGINGLKYFSTIIAVVMRTGHDLRRGVTWKIIAAASSGVATVANTYWDLVIDWGLLRRNAKNSWLRDKLTIPNRSIYFVAMVLNVILRLAWMQNILGFREAPFLHGKALIAIVASLEIIRRGIWNFFRLENEHLNNVGKYRAFKSVPLPFNHD
ncbi:phosphate transporter PHO1 homolog 9 [Eucalyptus grandis]|uniref:phosphate transporter PHO1 homolog 9 n=1 Tax=Eucalyptus grandis TaxID=71139 RepID=UPI00192E85EE|nr:phosphate transporter PHO1 homolog 9 [Eucalyptus grandis]